MGVYLWSPSRDDALGGLVCALSDLADEPVPHYYDYWGAETPESAELPMTYWSKGRILMYCEDAKSVRPDALPILEKMKLEDLRCMALVSIGKRPTGNMYDMRPGQYGEWRNTTFYMLDVENINRMVS